MEQVFRQVFWDVITQAFGPYLRYLSGVAILIVVVVALRILISEFFKGR